MTCDSQRDWGSCLCLTNCRETRVFKTEEITCMDCQERYEVYWINGRLYGDCENKCGSDDE